MNFAKMFKKESSSQVLIIVAAVVLIVALMSYSSNKGSDGMSVSGGNGQSGGVPPQGVTPSTVSPALPLGQNEKPLI